MEKQLSIPSFQSFGGAVKDNGVLAKARHFVANEFGLSETEIKGKNFKAVKELLATRGVDKDAIKASQKKYDSFRQDYYRQVNQVNAVLAADPRFRKTIKIWKTKAGKVSANVSYRETPKLSESATQRADNLARENEQLKARLAKLEALTA